MTRTDQRSSPSVRIFLRQNWIIFASAGAGLVCIVVLGLAVVSRFESPTGDAGEGAAGTFSPERVYLICGNDDGAPNDLNGCSIGLDGSFEDFGNAVRPLTQPLLSPDGTLIAFAEPGGRVVLRRPDGTAQLSLKLGALSGPLDWSADGSSLLVSDRSALAVIDLEESRIAGVPVMERHELPPGQDVLGVARFSPDGESIVVGTKRNDLAVDEIYGIVLIERASGARSIVGEQVVERDPTTFTGTFADPAFDSTGRRLAWADGISGRLAVLEVATGSIETVDLAQPPELITGVSWSPTGLIVVGVDAQLRLVDPGSGMTVTAPLPDEWSITASTPRWSADGTRFVTMVQTIETEALLDLVLVDLADGSVRLLTNSATPRPPISAFPGFPVWPATVLG